MAADMDISDEMENIDCSDPTVLNKYVLSGQIAQQVLLDLTNAIENEGIRDTVALCTRGDQLINEKCHATYKRQDMTRGVAFPTCVSSNELAGHFSPLEQAARTTLQDGDIIKIDLGVHMDGFAALAATTFQVGGGPITGRKADVVAAAWTAAECAIRMMKPGTTNGSITEMFQAVANEFNCNCLEGVLSHELRQFVIDGEKTILARPSHEQQVESFELEPNKVYAIDVVMSTGEGKAIRRDQHPTTIYKRVVENTYQLRSKHSRAFLKKVNTDYPAYPFNLRNFQDNMKTAKFGLKECMTHELLSDYPVLHEKEGEFIAQYKFTCIVRPNQGPLRVCGTGTLDQSLIQTENSIQNEELQKLLATEWEAPKRKKRKKKKKKKNPNTEAMDTN